MGILNLANIAFRQQRIERAITLYKQAIKQYPELTPFIQFNLELALHRLKKQGKNFDDQENPEQQKNTFPPPLHILFVLPNALESNNGYHVQHLAQQLNASKLAIATIAIPDLHYRPEQAGILSYSQLDDDAFALPFDLIHAWTPREIVRKRCQTLQENWQCPLVVHLEDNEEYLTSAITGIPLAQLTQYSTEQLDGIIPPSCYHPVHGRKFLNTVQGMSMIIDSLSHYNPTKKPGLTIAPPVDEKLFFPRSKNLRLRHQLNIADDSIVLVYTGNVHAGNTEEVQQLYQAVTMLNSAGLNTILLRTGHNPPHWIENPQHVRQLGWVKRQQLPDILAAADFLVQPGESDLFNDQRIPCKLPEYFAMGRPVILPRTNLGLRVRHKIEGYVVDNANATGIVAAIQEVLKTPACYDQLCVGARAFYEQHIATQKTANNLHCFYRNIAKEYYINKMK